MGLLQEQVPGWVPGYLLRMLKTWIQMLAGQDPENQSRLRQSPRGEEVEIKREEAPGDERPKASSETSSLASGDQGNAKLSWWRFLPSGSLSYRALAVNCP